MKKLLLIPVAILSVVFLSGCSDIPSSAPVNTQGSESKKQENIQKDLVNVVPTPQIKNSTARAAIAKRATIFDDQNKVTYIYLVNYGKVMAFYAVDGQAVNLRSYLTPMENIVDATGKLCDGTGYGNCSGGDGDAGYMVSAPDVDGTYGENSEGIFFFTTEGAYVEWKGDYMVSDQPLKLTTQPELVREIK